MFIIDSRYHFFNIFSEICPSFYIYLSSLSPYYIPLIFFPAHPEMIEDRNKGSDERVL